MASIGGVPLPNIAAVSSALKKTAGALATRMAAAPSAICQRRAGGPRSSRYEVPVRRSSQTSTPRVARSTTEP
jgi:hypothetical protein